MEGFKNKESRPVDSHKPVCSEKTHVRTESDEPAARKRKFEIDGKKMIIFSEILKPKFDE